MSRLTTAPPSRRLPDTAQLQALFAEARRRRRRRRLAAGLASLALADSGQQVSARTVAGAMSTSTVRRSRSAHRV